MSTYPPILDWSRQGRAELVEAHRARLTVLLEHSLGRLAERYGEELLLNAFGFKTLGEVIDFCLDRFAHGDIDPDKLQPESRSFRLFTEPRFWLAQKVGLRGYLAILARLERKEPKRRDAEPVQFMEEQTRVDVERLVERLATTLRQLHVRTCADMVAWWLHATDTLRAGWFDPPARPPQWEPAEKKERSLRAHDAIFRFQCLHRGLLQEGFTDQAHAVAREWLFRPCANAPPYRRSEAEIAEAFPALAPTGKQEIWRLRREGVEALLGLLVGAARHRPSSREPAARMEWQLLRQVLVKTTLVAFKLDEGRSQGLEQQLETLPAPDGLEELP